MKIQLWETQYRSIDCKRQHADMQSLLKAYREKAKAADVKTGKQRATTEKGERALDAKVSINKTTGAAAPSPAKRPRTGDEMIVMRIKQL